MTTVLTERQWAGARPGRPGGRGAFATRKEGQSKAAKVWKCQHCLCEYQAKPKTCDTPEWGCGRRLFWYFASRKEAVRARTLLASQARGEIRNLEMQPEYPLLTVEVTTAKPVPTGRKYVADFRYERLEGNQWLPVVEDVKPNSAAADDPLFKLKLAIVEASYGIKVRLVRAV